MRICKPTACSRPNDACPTCQPCPIRPFHLRPLALCVRATVSLASSATATKQDPGDACSPAAARTHWRPWRACPAICTTLRNIHFFNEPAAAAAPSAQQGSDPVCARPLLQRRFHSAIPAPTTPAQRHRPLPRSHGAALPIVPERLPPSLIVIRGRCRGDHAAARAHEPVRFRHASRYLGIPCGPPSSQRATALRDTPCRLGHAARDVVRLAGGWWSRIPDRHRASSILRFPSQQPSRNLRRGGLRRTGRQRRRCRGVPGNRSFRTPCLRRPDRT